MSYVIPAPDVIAAATTDLANIGSTIRAATALAALPTTAVVAAGRMRYRRAWPRCSGHTRRRIRRSVRRRQHSTASLCCWCIPALDTTH
jgi:hypothetical protein